MAGNSFTFNFQLSVDADASAAVVETPASGITQHSSARMTNKKNESNFIFLVGVEKMMRDKMSQQIDSDVALTPNGGEGRCNVDALYKVCSPGGNCGTVGHGIYDELKKQSTDIIPGTYEGGLKVWECSLDLCRYLRKHELKPDFAMELGCGHGLPGCLMLRSGAKVLFSDFNDFVLKDVTVTNICLNTKQLPLEQVAKSVVLGAGDWMEMSKCVRENEHEFEALPSNGRFDLVLAAETTYTTEACEDTALLLSKHLIPVHGIALVATKRYYFGCGGGSDVFRKAAATHRVILGGQGYGLIVETAETFDSGSGNIRELLEVRLQPENRPI